MKTYTFHFGNNIGDITVKQVRYAKKVKWFNETHYQFAFTIIRNGIETAPFKWHSSINDTLSHKTTFTEAFAKNALYCLFSDAVCAFMDYNEYISSNGVEDNYSERRVYKALQNILSDLSIVFSNDEIYYLSNELTDY